MTQNKTAQTGGRGLRIPGEMIDRQDFPEDFDAEFDAAFPADEPRKYQKEAVETIVRAFTEQDKDVVMVDAPPGLGKSFILYTAMVMLNGRSYYITPLKLLQEQLAEDDLIGDSIEEIMGRNNYSCILPDADPGTTVDVGKCQRDEGFDCDIKGSCPYYSQRSKAMNSMIMVGNLSYIMSSPVTINPDDGAFSPRDIIAIDECQGTPSWAMGFVGVVFSDNILPDGLLRRIEWPDEDDRDDFQTCLEWVRDEVRPAVTSLQEEIGGMGMISKENTKVLESLGRLEDKIDRLLNDVEDNHWIVNYSYDINKNRDNVRKIEFKPIKVGRFLGDLLWSKGDKVILSSATIPKGDWLSEIGLGDRDVTRINIPSIFPVENRPVVMSEAVGKMTYEEREDTIGPMVDKVKDIAEYHSGDKGIIHCRGYNYIKMFKEAARSKGFSGWLSDNVAYQDRQNREKSLEDWVSSDKQIFLSVNMAEGVDLEGDKCRWQVLMKCLYPSMADRRVEYRIKQLNDWDWYNQKAVTQIEQAYGRAVRSPTDSAVFYVLDSSAVDLMRRNKGLFHDWFLEAVDIDV